MSQPTDPLRPDDLAKRIAERLSDSSPPKKRFSFRDSVFVGGLLNGVVILTVAAVVVAGIFVGVNWLLSLGDDSQPNVEADADPSGDPASILIPAGPTTIPVEDEVVGAGGSSTTTTLGGPFVSPTTTLPGPFVTFPATTTSTTPPATTTPPTSPPTTAPPTTGPPTTAATTTTSSSLTTTSSTATTMALDTTPPVFGPTPDITVEATAPSGAAVVFAITASDDVDGPIAPVCGPPSGSTFSIGTALVVCSATDSSGNVANASFDVTVQDTIGPNITISGANPQTIVVGGVYTELGATASDLVDGDLTSQIAIDSTSVDTSTIGTYSVTYQVSDTAGNQALVQRTVDVVP